MPPDEHTTHHAQVDLVDLDAPNHVAGQTRAYLKLSFSNVRELMNVKRDLAPTVWGNRRRMEEAGRGVAIPRRGPKLAATRTTILGGRP